MSDVETELDEWEPADRGLRAWVVVTASFLVKGIAHGFNLTYSIIYASLLEHNKNLGNVLLASNVSLVMSLTTGVDYLVAPLVGMLVDVAGYRISAALGSVVLAISLLSSSWLLSSIPTLYFTFSVLSGVGIGIIQVTCITALGLYFRRRLGLVNGIVTAGCGFFGATFPSIVKWLLPHVGLPGVLRVFAGITFMTALLSLAYKIPAGAPTAKPVRGCNLVNRENWRNKKYIVWCASQPFVWFGMMIPFVHIAEFARVNFPDEDSFTVTMCLNVTAIISRIGFGVLLDNTKIDSIRILQVTYLLAGVLTALIPVANSWSLMIVFTLLIGLLNGGFSGLLGPIATKLCGVAGAPQGLGFMYGISAIPCMAGPVVAGYLYDQTHSYLVPFLVAGGTIFLGGIIISAVFCVASPSDANYAKMDGD